MALTPEQATSLILALRDLTTETGTSTTRTQNKILRSLPDEDLLRVAVALKNRQHIRDILSGTAQSGVVVSEVANVIQ